MLAKPHNHKNLSIRLKGYDYRNKGAYFITICTQYRNHYFGECANGVMQLSPIRLLAEQFWFEIPNHFPNASLGAFVVMPNHIHGILVIDEKLEIPRTSDSPTINLTSNPNDSSESTINQQPKNRYFQNLSAPAKSVSTMMRAYKSAVTTESRKIGLTFAWQARFHDHIIRNYSEWGRIHEYILNNPAKWKEDRFFQFQR